MKFLAVVLSFTTLTAFAATSGSLNLKGKVALILSISVAPETIAAGLPLDTTQSDTKVATVTERSNSGTGYKVTITSTNQGKLKRSNGPETVAYVLKYDGSVLDLTAPVVQVHPAVPATEVKDVSISYTGVPAENMIAGTYQDTVKFTISAN